MILIYIFFLIKLWADNPSTWFGTAPTCEGNWYKCDPFDMKLLKFDAYGDGKYCVSGYKALCELKDRPAIFQSQLSPWPNSRHVDLKVMSYNIFERPWVVTHDGQIERTCRIPRVLSSKYPDIDVIGLQENFMSGCDPQMDYKRIFPFYGWEHVSEVVGSSASINGGVRFISKHPLYDIQTHIYSHSTLGTADKLASKGFIYAKIVKEDIPIHLINTHLQAQECEACDKTRLGQVQEIRDFLDQKRIPKDEPVILMGDLNFDLKRDHENVEKAMNILDFENLRNTGHLEYTYDINRNDVVEAGEKPSWLDYVTYSRKNKKPSDYKFEAIDLKAEAEFTYCNSAPMSPYWVFYKSVYCRVVKTTRDLSDHFPVMATFTFKYD